jgi:hypothetical protein
VPEALLQWGGVAAPGPLLVWRHLGRTACTSCGQARWRSTRTEGKTFEPMREGFRLTAGRALALAIWLFLRRGGEAAKPLTAFNY